MELWLATISLIEVEELSVHCLVYKELTKTVALGLNLDNTNSNWRCHLMLT